jgi:hypothetical protein
MIQIASNVPTAMSAAIVLSLTARTEESPGLTNLLYHFAGARAAVPTLATLPFRPLGLDM